MSVVIVLLNESCSKYVCLHLHSEQQTFSASSLCSCNLRLSSWNQGCRSHSSCDWWWFFLTLTGWLSWLTASHSPFSRFRIRPQEAAHSLYFRHAARVTHIYYKGGKGYIMERFKEYFLWSPSDENLMWNLRLFVKLEQQRIHFFYKPNFFSVGSVILCRFYQSPEFFFYLLVSQPYREPDLHC